MLYSRLGIWGVYENLEKQALQSLGLELAGEHDTEPYSL